jgi:hypothetical protein
MTNKEFYYWLNGYFTLNPVPLVSQREIAIIKNHLNLVKEVDGFLSEDNQKINDWLASSDFSAVPELLTERIKTICN